jgi:hypothetical protein
MATDMNNPNGSSPMTRQEQKAAAFRALHAGEPFVIPNPWVVGGRLLAIAREPDRLAPRRLCSDPASAVFAPGDGLGPYRRLLEGNEHRLTERGTLLIQFRGRVLEAPHADC